MFDKLEERINKFMESNKGTKISYQLYIKDQNSNLILAIETLHRQRIHSKVLDKQVFHKLNKI